jgi:hypothetical protein
MSQNHFNSRSNVSPHGSSAVAVPATGLVFPPDNPYTACSETNHGRPWNVSEQKRKTAADSGCDLVHGTTADFSHPAFIGDHFRGLVRDGASGTLPGCSTADISGLIHSRHDSEAPLRPRISACHNSHEPMNLPQSFRIFVRSLVILRGRIQTAVRRKKIFYTLKCKKACFWASRSALQKVPRCSPSVSNNSLKHHSQ